MTKTVFKALSKITRASKIISGDRDDDDVMEFSGEELEDRPSPPAEAQEETDSDDLVMRLKWNQFT